MTMQWLAVAIIVPLCTLVAVWNLMGASGRRRVSRWLARPLSAAWQRRLITGNDGACRCDGCDQSAASQRAPAQAIVQVHRRR
jgi:hypothetical protein